jgi:hypothetical protein
VVLFWTAALVFVLGVGALPLGDVAEASPDSSQRARQLVAAGKLGGATYVEDGDRAAARIRRR